MAELEAIRLIHSLTTPKDFMVGNMATATHCMQRVIHDIKPGLIPNNLLFGVDMGFATATACGLALARPERRVIAMEGDGALLMRLVVLADVAEANPSNLTIVVIDNEAYNPTYYDPSDPHYEYTATSTVADLSAIAKGCGFKNAVTVHTFDELKDEFTKALKRNELSIIVAKVELTDECRKVIFDKRHWVDVDWESAFMRNMEEISGTRLISVAKGRDLPELMPRRLKAEKQR